MLVLLEVEVMLAVAAVDGAVVVVGTVVGGIGVGDVIGAGVVVDGVGCSCVGCVFLVGVLVGVTLVIGTGSEAGSLASLAGGGLVVIRVMSGSESSLSDDPLFSSCVSVG